MKRLDLLLLVLFAVRHRGYYAFAPDDQGQVFAAMGAVCILVLLLVQLPWWPVAAYIAWQETMVAACAVAYIVNPLPPSSEQCSAQTGVQLGAVGAVALGLLALHALDRIKRR